MNKKFFTVFAISLALLAPSISKAADTVAYKAQNDEQFIPANPSTMPQGLQGMLVSEKTVGVGAMTVSFFEYNDVDASGKVSTVVACTSVNDPKCTPTQTSFENVHAVMPLCTSASDTDCVEGISATDANGTALDVTPTGTFPESSKQYFTGDKTLYVPNGGGSLLFNIPGAPHPGGTTYMASVMEMETRQGTGKFLLQDLVASIQAVKLIDGTYEDQSLSTDATQYSRQNMNRGIGNPVDKGCVVMTAKQCAAAYPLPTEIRFGIKYRVSRPLQGWFHGRMKSPDANITTNNNGTAISVSALPIKVPINMAYVPVDQLPPAVLSYYQNQSFWAGQGVQWPLNGPQGIDFSSADKSLANLRNITFQHLQGMYTPDGMAEYLMWLPLFKDVASAMPTQWSVRTMSLNPNNTAINDCASKINGTAGLVMTNAAFYLDGPPEFNSAEGTLQYKVAATHYMTDGTTPFLGTYDLVMNSQVARCLYHFTSAPIKATVAVVSADGKDNVATSIITEKNGFLYFGAYGFTFSNPTVKITLTQDPPPAPAPAPVAPTPTVAKKITITCVKGKVVKKVIAVKPACPSGFKKVN